MLSDFKQGVVGAKKITDDEIRGGFLLGNNSRVVLNLVQGSWNSLKTANDSFRT